MPMKIHFEIDADSRDFVLENHWDTAVPVSYESYGDGPLYVTCYPDVEQAVRSVMEMYAEDPFSDEALAALWEAVDPFFAEHHYRTDRFRDRWGHILRLRAEDLDGSLVQDTTRLLTAEDEDSNRTTYDLATSIESDYVAYGTVADGQVVSASVTNGPVDGPSGLIEVGLETAPAYRRRGYALSNLAALSGELIRRGYTPEYRCQRYNEASLRAALRVGYKQIGKFYDYVGRRD